MSLSLNKNLKNVLLYAGSLIAIFFLFKFIIYLIPVAVIGWATYKFVGFSRQKLSEIKVNRLSKVNRKHIDRAFMHRDYDNIFKPTEFEKDNSVIDVEYEEIRR